MRARNLVWLIALLALLNTQCLAITFSETTLTTHFALHHSPRLASTAGVIGDSCEFQLRDIARKLGVTVPDHHRIDVYLYPDQAAYSKVTGHDDSNYTLGRASSDNQIEIEVSGAFSNPEQVASHEITHVLIDRKLGPKTAELPLWANEGIAKYMSDDWDLFDQTLLADATAGCATLPLSSITREFPSGSNQALAYAEGASAIRFFVKSYGEHKLPKLLDSIAQTGDFNKAMQLTTGLSESQFESNWKRSINSNYDLAQIYRISRVAGAITLPALAILAFWGIQRRKRRLIKQYEEEEEYSSFRSLF